MRTASSCLALHKQHFTCLINGNFFFACFFFLFLFWWITSTRSRYMQYLPFFYNCQWNVLFSSFSVPLLCYAGLSAVGARAGTSSRGKKTLKRTVKSVCAVTSAEPSNELVALPQSRSQETNHSSRFETEGYCWASWTLRSAPALVRTFTSPLFSCHGK